MNQAELENLHKRYKSLIPLKGKKPFEPKWQQYCRSPRDYNPDDFKGRNVGIPCGPANGLLVIDVDDNDGFNEYVKQHDLSLPETSIHETGSGMFHFAYRYPDDGKRYGNRSIKNDAGKKIFDIRGDGGQVVAPGSIHPDTGRPYKFHKDLPMAKAPEWLKQMSLGEELPSSSNGSSKSPSELPDWWEAGPRGFQELPVEDRRLGMQILDGKYGDKVRRLLDGDWYDYASQSEADLALCSHLYRMCGGDPQRVDRIIRYSGLYRPKWDSPRGNSTYGWITLRKVLDGQQKDTTFEAVDYSSAGLVPAEDVTNALAARVDIPDHILHPGCLIGDIMEYMDQSCAVSHPVYGLAAAIALIGTVAGQQVMTPTGLRTNIYAINLGFSGTGKDAPFQAIEGLMALSDGTAKRIGSSEVASAAAILRSLTLEQVQLLLADEIGMVFKQMRNPASQMADVPRVLTKLFSGTARPYEKRYAISKNDILLPYHHLSLLGATTPGVFFDSISAGDVASGFLARCLFFPSDHDPIRPKIDISTTGIEGLNARLNRIASLPVVSVPNRLGHAPQPFVIEWTTGAQRAFQEFGDYEHELRIKYKEDEIKSAFFNRMAEHAAKLALIHTVSRLEAEGLVSIDDIFEEPEVIGKTDSVDMAWGIELARILCNWAAFCIEQRVDESDFHELNKKLVDIMEGRLRDRERRTVYRSLGQKIRTKKSFEIKEALQSLKEAGAILEIEHEYQPGRKTSVFALAEGYHNAV